MPAPGDPRPEEAEGGRRPAPVACADPPPGWRVAMERSLAGLRRTRAALRCIGEGRLVPPPGACGSPGRAVFMTREAGAWVYPDGIMRPRRSGRGAGREGRKLATRLNVDGRATSGPVWTRFARPAAGRLLPEGCVMENPRVFLPAGKRLAGAPATRGRSFRGSDRRAGPWSGAMAWRIGRAGIRKAPVPHVLLHPAVIFCSG
jgi:hypothetical protein